MADGGSVMASAMAAMAFNGSTARGIWKYQPVKMYVSPAPRKTAVGFRWFSVTRAIAMGNRMPISPNAPATSRRVSGQAWALGYAISAVFKIASSDRKDELSSLR